jgi:hypothetical protein
MGARDLSRRVRKIVAYVTRLPPLEFRIKMILSALRAYLTHCI